MFEIKYFKLSFAGFGDRDYVVSFTLMGVLKHHLAHLSEDEIDKIGKSIRALEVGSMLQCPEHGLTAIALEGRCA